MFNFQKVFKILSGTVGKSSVVLSHDGDTKVNLCITSSGYQSVCFSNTNVCLENILINWSHNVHLYLICVQHISRCTFKMNDYLHELGYIMSAEYIM